MLLPYVRSDENWIGEGLASYYQNVLMARSAQYGATFAWQKIIEGFHRGEQSVPLLGLEDAMPRGGWDGIMKTYWGAPRYSSWAAASCAARAALGVDYRDGQVLIVAGAPLGAVRDAILAPAQVTGVPEPDCAARS